jgi:hypothetical protein
VETTRHQVVHYVHKEMDEVGAMANVNGRSHKINVWQLVLVVVTFQPSLVVPIVKTPAVSARKGMVEDGAMETANGMEAPAHVCQKPAAA